MSLPVGVESPAAARVSIAMASYNGERFIEEQLNSLASQTHAPYELVVCDDQSTDRTQQLVESFAARVSFPVRFIRNPDRLYFSSNFMKAAGLCTGDFIAFCDQDDIWDPRKIEASLQALAQPGVVLCVHDATKVDDAGNVVGLETRRVPKGIVHALDPFMVFSGFTCTFPRGLIELLPPDRRPMDVIETKRKLSHDRWVCYLASLVGSIANLDESLALYRQHHDNAAGWMRQRRGKAELFDSFRNKFGFYLQKRLRIISDFRRLSEEISLDGLHAEIFSAERLEIGRDRLRRYEEIFERRYAIARPDSRFVRLRNLAKCWREGVYEDPISGETSRRSAVMDGLGALLARRGQADSASRRLAQSA